MNEFEGEVQSGDLKVNTDTAESHHSQAESRIFPCEACGADVVFNIGTQHLKCPYCGHEQKLSIEADAILTEHDFHEMLESLLEHHETVGATEGFKEVSCDACGGIVVFEGTLTSTRCPYCDSPIQLEGIHEMETRIKPDGVLPFQVDEQRAKNSIKNWVASLWFAPNDFKKSGVEGKLNGVYIPYWTFDSMTFVAYVGERGEEYRVTVGTGKNRRTVTRVRWYPASGNFQRFFDDVLVLACHKMSPDLIHGLEPWPLNLSLPFTREALAGYLARTYDVELEPGFHLAKPRIETALRSDVNRRIGGDRQRISRMGVDYSAITFKFLLLPIWLLSYRYKGKVYQMMINAATGKVSGERPWSAWKIAGAIILGTTIVLGSWALIVSMQ